MNRPEEDQDDEGQKTSKCADPVRMKEERGKKSLEPLCQEEQLARAADAAEADHVRSSLLQPSMKKSLHREKELQWESILEKLQLDEGELEDIEVNIREPVRALNAMGLPTNNSCEGHDDHGYLVSWVRVGAPNKPKERCVGQEEFEQEAYEKMVFPKTY